VFPQCGCTADESVCGVGYEGEEVNGSTEMERKSSRCWKQSGMGGHGSCWLKTPLLPINHIDCFRQKCQPDRAHSYTTLQWQKWPVMTIGGHLSVTWLFVTPGEAGLHQCIVF